MAASSFMRFAEPLNRKMPSTLVAVYVSVTVFHFAIVILTFLFQIYAAFSHDDWNIAIDITLPVRIN